MEFSSFPKFRLKLVREFYNIVQRALGNWYKRIRKKLIDIHDRKSFGQKLHAHSPFFFKQCPL